MLMSERALRNNRDRRSGTTMERPSTAPRWKMQMRILFARGGSSSSAAAKAVWRRKRGPQNGPMPMTDAGESALLQKNPAVDVGHNYFLWNSGEPMMSAMSLVGLTVLFSSGLGSADSVEHFALWNRLTLFCSSTFDALIRARRPGCRDRCRRGWFAGSNLTSLTVFAPSAPCAKVEPLDQRAGADPESLETSL